MNDLQIDRLRIHLESIALDDLRIKYTKKYLHAFGSELAVLRLFAKYQANGKVHDPKATVGQDSKSYEHYFCLAA